MRAENNKVEFTGTIITEPEFNHEVFGDFIICTSKWID